MKLTERDFHSLAMAMCPGMTARHMLRWEAAGHTPEDFFAADTQEICRSLDIPSTHPIAKSARREVEDQAREEAEFIVRHSIRTFFATSDDYPLRLAQHHTAPAVLFAVGNGSLDMPKSIASVGTRRPTPHGSKICGELIERWCEALPDLTVISGLAYGIDAISHNAALSAKHPTIAVVAHGLDRIYPAQHRGLATEIAAHGGLIVSEYPSGTSPYRKRFLERNRIIAALSDATVVMESAIRGGALSTAGTAFELDRDVLAVPGRIGDEMSMGCNMLIRRNKAHILTDANCLLEVMNWKPAEATSEAVQPSLFTPLSATQKPIYDIIKESADPITADAIISRSRMKAETVMTILSDLEFDGIIIRYPGNRFTTV